MLDKADVIIVGGGITGAAIAQRLARYQLDVVWCEAQPDVAMGASKANSGILHAGFDPHPGTLKAKLNVRGLALYRELAEPLGLEIKYTGSLVVAKTPAEMTVLEQLLARGRENGVPGELTILTREQVLQREPNLAPDISGALWASAAGVICPYGAVIALANNAVRNGVRLYTECKVEEILTEQGRVTGVRTNKGLIAGGFVLNAAGIAADDLSRTAGDDSFTIKARRGEYILFDRTVGTLVHSVIFPAPVGATKGILVSPTVHGNLFIGPNAQEGVAKGDTATTAAGLAEIVAGGQRLVPNLPLAAAITQFAGLRAAADCGDFVIGPSPKVRGLIHVAGIQSPGLTAAPAIAEMVCELLADAGLVLRPKATFDPREPRPVRFRELSREEQDALIRQDANFGRVICRCETVTEGEIVAAIHAPCGARTVDGVKRRTRAGMGRCQGGFCGPRVAAILARELGIPLTKVRKDGLNSYLYYEKEMAAEVKDDAGTTV